MERDTYICFIHLVGNHGPTEEYPDPILAAWTGDDLVKEIGKAEVFSRINISLGPAKKNNS